MAITTYKKYILLILVSFLFACKQKVTVHIMGDVKIMDGVKVRLASMDYKTFYDSTIVKNGKFEFNSTLPEKDFYEIDFISPVVNKWGWMRVCLFYAENNSKYSFVANSRDELVYNKYTIKSNSSVQQKINEFRIRETVLGDKYRAKKKYLISQSYKFLDAGQTKLYNAYSDSILRVDSLVSAAYNIIRHTFVNQNKNTVYTPYLISQASDIFESYQLYKKVLDNLSPEVKKSKYYDDATELLKASKALYKGANAPNLVGVDIAGKNSKIEYAKNNLTLINFWASYCVPCREETPELRKLYNKYKTAGFNIISVSIDENPKYWMQASKQDSIPWLNIAELKEQQDSKNIKNFVVKVIPCNYLIDNKGQILARDINLTDLENRIAQLPGRDNIN
jgi:thiol-disulfide isomerase/thioredoxin